MKIPGLGGATGPKRPWLAALLALALTGLGHAYLRRWLRGLGWLAATYAVTLLFVPTDAVEAFATGGPLTEPVAILPPLLVVLASVVDAYLLARRTRQRSTGGPAAADASPGAGPADGGSERTGTDAIRSPEGPAGLPGALGDDVEPAACPECGKDLDPELDFCPWCTAELDRAGPNGDGGTAER